MKCSFRVIYSHPVERVWPYLVEPEKWMEYVPALVERTRLGEGPIGPGSKWKAIDRVGPLLIEYSDEILELEPYRKVVWAHSFPWNARTEYVVEGKDETDLHVDFEAKLGGKIRWMDLIPDSWSTRVFRRDMERLGRYLDSKTDS